MRFDVPRALSAFIVTFLAVPLAAFAEARADAAPSCHDTPGMKHIMTPDGGMIMVMQGIPLWVFLTGIVGVLVVSFIGTELLGTPRFADFRLNLIKNKRAYDLVKSRWFQAVPQLAVTVILAFLLYAGIFGDSNDNIVPVAVWTIWWGGLIFAVLFFGAGFCFVCPWDGLANVLSRFSLSRRVPSPSLGLPYPSWLRNVYPAIALFVLLTWLELGQGVTSSPTATAYMGLGMAVLAVASAVLWDKKKFCHYLCPVGRISGMYANFSPIEVRRRNANVCNRCKTHDCLHGNEDGYACPTGILLKEETTATYCTMCTECVKSCQKRNVAINIRPFGADLSERSAMRWDESWLVVSLLTLTLFHGFSMTSAWENFEPGRMSLMKWLNATLGTTGVSSFTIAMIGACAVPVALYALSCWAGARWAGDESIGASRLFRSYAHSLLPIALFYHLAHNAMHVFEEGGHIVPLLSDPLGTGADYFGTASVDIGPLLSEEPLWFLQVGLILLGHVAGIVFAHRAGHRLYSDRRAAVKSLLPTLLMMIVVSAIGLGLMHLDMNMRVGRM